MPVFITVQLSDTAVASLRGGANSDPRTELENIAAESGGRWAQLHAGVADAELARYFVLAVPDDDAARRSLDRLRAARDVLAAYIKPPDELPGGP